MNAANEIKDPTGRDPATNWLATATAGSATLSSSTDTDLGNCVNVVCTATAAVDVYPRAPDGVPVKPREVLAIRFKIKAGTGGGQFGIRISWYTAAGGFISGTTGGVGDFGFSTNEVGEIEGYETAVDGAYLAQVYVHALVNASTFKVTDAQAQSNPWGDWGAYGDGDSTGWTWAGTPNASRSTGTRTPDKPAIFGYSDNSRVSATPEQSHGEFLDTLKQAGGNSLRFAPFNTAYGLVQADANAPVVWEDGRGGAVLEACRAANVSVLGLVGPLPWMVDGTRETIRGMTQPDAFAALCVQLIEDWGDILCGIEVYNEPNLDFFWNYGWGSQQTPSPTKYVESLNAIYEAVHAVTDDIPVLGGALAHTSVDSGFSLSLVNFLDGMVTAGALMDGLSVHPYGANPTATATQVPYLPGPRSGASTGGIFNQGTWASMAQAFDRVDVPLWVTEIGNPSRNDPQEERWQAQAHALMRGMLKRRYNVPGYYIHELVRRSTAVNEGWDVVRMPSVTHLGSELLV